MSTILDKRIFNLLKKRYGARDATNKEALHWIENSKWLESQGFYETVSYDFYRRDLNIMVNTNCLLNPPKELQLIVLKKIKEASEWKAKKPSSN